MVNEGTLSEGTLKACGTSAIAHKNMCPYEHEIMALESPLIMSQSKKLQSKSFPFAVFHADSADTSGYNSRCCSAPSLARASPPDLKVNNTPFPHTSCQPEVPTATTPGTLPQRPTKPNQPTARSERV